jgi:hypothetical protein
MILLTLDPKHDKAGSELCLVISLDLSQVVMYHNTLMFVLIDFVLNLGIETKR